MDLFNLNYGYAEYSRQVICWLLSELTIAKKLIAEITGLPCSYVVRVTKDVDMRVRMGDPWIQARLRYFFAQVRRSGEQHFAHRAVNALVGPPPGVAVADDEEATS